MSKGAAVIAAGLLLAEPAIAQRADAPDVRAGDRWQFVVYYTVPSTTPNREWIVTSVGAERIDATENGEPLTLTRDLNVLESPTTAQSNQRLLKFPLELGKTWRYATEWLFKPKGSRGSAAGEVKVVAFEKVSVPAGEFEAFKLTATEQLSGTSPTNTFYAGEVTSTYWYAPSARVIVRSVRHNPYLGPSTVELVAYELKR